MGLTKAQLKARRCFQRNSSPGKFYTMFKNMPLDGAVSETGIEQAVEQPEVGLLNNNADLEPETSGEKDQFNFTDDEISRNEEPWTVVCNRHSDNSQLVRMFT